VELDGFEIIPNDCQTGVGSEVGGQLFYYEFGHGLAHLPGESNFTPKSLIYKDK
jgi:hypothetical protein